MSIQADQWLNPDWATGSEPDRAAKRTEPGDVPVVRASGAPIHVYPRSEYHELSMSCWCHPYLDAVQPRVVIHRKAGRA
jgi:hypothetical protein